MSIVHAQSTVSAQAVPGSGDVVTLSGETVWAIQFGGGNADAHLIIDNDGNVYKRSNFGTYTQVDSSTDWVRPTTSSPGLYEVRFTGLTGSALFTSTAAEDAWHSLSSGDFILRQRVLGGGFDSAISTFTVEIRLNGGAVLSSASYTLNVSTEL